MSTYRIKFTRKAERAAAQSEKQATPVTPPTHDENDRDARRRTGKVGFFSPSKRWGYIIPDDGGPDVFVHLSAVPATGNKRLKSGDRVSFVVGNFGKRKCAKDLKLLGPVPRTGLQFDGPRQGGTVVWFNHNKSYGFITPDWGKEDVYFSRTEMLRCDLRESDVAAHKRVEFTLAVNLQSKHGRPQAVDLVALLDK